MFGEISVINNVHWNLITGVKPFWLNAQTSIKYFITSRIFKSDSSLPRNHKLYLVTIRSVYFYFECVVYQILITFSKNNIYLFLFLVLY